VDNKILRLTNLYITIRKNGTQITIFTDTLHDILIILFNSTEQEPGFTGRKLALWTDSWRTPSTNELFLCHPE